MDAIDLNADLGEGFPYDGELIEIVSSANVACGFHAGDAVTMRRVCELCVEHGVVVGAQVSYRDRAGFGRRAVDIAYDDLLADLREQLAALTMAAEAAGTRIGYLKPHGALYHRTVTDAAQARAVVDAAAGLAVLGLPDSLLLDGAERAGLPVAREFFADRAYRRDGTLVPRSEPGAVIADPRQVALRIARLAETGDVRAQDGTPVTVHADSICVHGDTPDAVGVARVVATVLTEHGIAIRGFA